MQANEVVLGESVELLSKICPCCGKAYDLDAWYELRNHGYTEISDMEAMEFRTCQCGSTMTHRAWRYDGDGYTTTTQEGLRQYVEHDYTLRNAICTALHELVDGKAEEAVITKRRWS